MAASSSALLLLLAPHFLLDKHIESVSSFIHLSRARFASHPVAMVSAPVWGWTCVYCIYYGMLRKERADWSAGALWVPHSSVWDVVCFFLCEAVVCSSQRNAESRRPYEGTVITTPTLIGWDVPRVHSERRRVVKCVCCMLRLLDENQGLRTEPPLKDHHIPMNTWLEGRTYPWSVGNSSYSYSCNQVYQMAQ